MESVPIFANFKLHLLSKFQDEAAHNPVRYDLACRLLDLRMALQLHRSLGGFIVVHRVPLQALSFVDITTTIQVGSDIGPRVTQDSPLLRFAIRALSATMFIWRISPGCSMSEVKKLWARTFFVALYALVEDFMVSYQVTVQGATLLHILSPEFRHFTTDFCAAYEEAMVNLALHTMKVSILDSSAFYCNLVPSLHLCDELLISENDLSYWNRELVLWWSGYQGQWRRGQDTIRFHIALDEPNWDEFGSP
ncbi:hypothetical protein BDZ89DRAFT_1135093 [Hymenopellis radicata]|nr:hypothetical protein BDZ89DRAFT_1135093 [Hymenopellis radicata]